MASVPNLFVCIVLYKNKFKYTTFHFGDPEYKTDLKSKLFYSRSGHHEF